MVNMETLYSNCILKIIDDDVNENVLIFPTNKFTIKVHEGNTNQHTTVLMAIDPDVGELLYSIRADTEKNVNIFRIN